MKKFGFYLSYNKENKYIAFIDFAKNKHTITVNFNQNNSKLEISLKIPSVKFKYYCHIILFIILPAITILSNII